MTKITLAIPSNRGIKNKTVESIMRLIANNVNGDYEFHCICPSEGYTIAENRNYIAVQALKNDSDYVFMVDDDMVFDSDILDVLISNNKPICGVTYHPRCETSPNAVHLDETHIIEIEKNKDNPKYNKVFECKAVGTGIILIKTSVFLAMAQPYFAFEYFDNGCVKTGEDWYFCLKAKELGIKTYADPTVDIKHIGEKLF
jgi:GT2 family glycosyltransferase